jgi:PKD repeat protein
MSITQNIAPVTVSFTDTSSGDELSYLWNFGDGSTSTQRNPSHTFQAGVWEVILTVTNESDQTDQSSTVIVATDAEVPSNGPNGGPPGGPPPGGPPPGAPPPGGPPVG